MSEIGAVGGGPGARGARAAEVEAVIQGRSRQDVGDLAAARGGAAAGPDPAVIVGHAWSAPRS